MTSEDIDFFGNTNEAMSLANAFGVQFIPSPEKGGMRGLVLGVIEYKNLKIEILGHVNGLKDAVARKAVLSETYKGFTLQVLHPVPLYEAKGANLIQLDQKDRQDERHIQAMEAILPLYLSDISADSQREDELLNSLDRLADFSLSSVGIALVKKGRPSPIELIPSFKSSLSPRLKKWKDMMYPVWMQRLEKKKILPHPLN